MNWRVKQHYHSGEQVSYYYSRKEQVEFQGSGWAEVLAIEFNDRLQEEQIQTNNMIASKSSRLPALRVKRSEAPRDHFAAKSLKAQLQDSAFPCTRKETASLKPRDHFCAKIKTSCDSPMCKCLVPEERWAVLFQRPLQNCGPLSRIHSLSTLLRHPNDSGALPHG